MAAKVGGDDEAEISDINVTPFVDIVLVLLIILMVTSVEIVKASIQVDLPKAASGGDAVESTLNIVVTLDGKVYLDGYEADEAAIVAKINEEKAKNAKLQAVIAADKGVVYGKVVDVIDIVKQNGVTGFALNIDREGGTPVPTPAPVPQETAPSETTTQTP
jgi:biopolymer transport protein ExbD